MNVFLRLSVLVVSVGLPVLSLQLLQTQTQDGVQKPYPAEAQRRVHFPITTRFPQVQKLYDQGVLQLHCFWHADAERTFRRAVSIDRDCAMAWWGLALANVNNRDGARQFVTLAAARQDIVSHRERMHIDALHQLLTSRKTSQVAAGDLIQAYRQIAEKYPDDLESWAFYARMLYQQRAALDKNSYRQIDGILARVSSKEPLHPAYHYRGPWQPWAAPDWVLQDAQGAALALKDYRGKPLIVILYLGHGCLHCVAQIQTFAPLTGKFRAAGISLVGISTEDTAELCLALKNYKDGNFAFPLLSNAALDVFKAYYAYDGSKKEALHGTFLIDADGMICWQQISHQPYMDAEFLLQHSAKLLSADHRFP